MRTLVKFALSTGLRQGELLALSVDDIDDMTVSVNKRVKMVKIFSSRKEFTYEFQTSAPKTESSIRKVPIPSWLLADLKELEKLRHLEKLKTGEAYHDIEFLFPSEVRTTLNARNLLRSWQRIFETIYVTYKKFHVLRHTYVTLLLKKGTPLLTVSRLLGQTSIKTTQI
ncbi:MAG: site-specific integrase [Eubacteriaceae bacterium]|nr:site-specific integrase [Eubacteriaceae bacterium]